MPHRDIKIEDRHIRWAIILQSRYSLCDALDNMEAAYIKGPLMTRLRRLIIEVDTALWRTTDGLKVDKM